MEILGAGMAGCLAGIINPKAKIYEAAGENYSVHKAVLRFRSDAISKITGIVFDKVKVMKSIWYDGKEASISPRFISMYGKKVGDFYSVRSIVNVESVDRWIAPDNFHDILKDILKKNISYNITVDIGMLKEMKRPIISTLPIMVLSKLLGMQFDIGERKMSSIYVYRYKIKDCRMYSTVYYPQRNFDIYRASITDDILSIESIGSALSDIEYNQVLSSFGIELNDVSRIGSYCQNYGKLVAINEQIRREFIMNSTINHGVYSLGRFAIWKNILLDDVLNDIYRIREFINKGHYEYLKKENVI